MERPRSRYAAVQLDAEDETAAPKVSFSPNNRADIAAGVSASSWGNFNLVNRFFFMYVLSSLERYDTRMLLPC